MAKQGYQYLTLSLKIPNICDSNNINVVKLLKHLINITAVEEWGHK